MSRPIEFPDLKSIEDINKYLVDWMKWFSDGILLACLITHLTVRIYCHLINKLKAQRESTWPIPGPEVLTVDQLAINWRAVDTLKFFDEKEAFLYGLLSATKCPIVAKNALAVKRAFESSRDDR